MKKVFIAVVSVCLCASIVVGATLISENKSNQYWVPSEIIINLPESDYWCGTKRILFWNKSSLNISIEKLNGDSIGVIEYTFDQEGNPISVSAMDIYEVDYTYDENRVIVKGLESGCDLFEYVYQYNNGRIEKSFYKDYNGNTETYSYEYDEYGRIKSTSNGWHKSIFVYQGLQIYENKISEITKESVGDRIYNFNGDNKLNEEYLAYDDYGNLSGISVDNEQIIEIKWEKGTYAQNRVGMMYINQHLRECIEDSRTFMWKYEPYVYPYFATIIDLMGNLITI